MNFKVKFQGRNGFAVKLREEEIGLFEVSMIRERLNAALPMERIAGIIKETLWDDVVIELGEQQARETGLFQHRNNITVTGRVGFLNQHTRLQVACNRDDETGEFLEAWISRRINEEALLDEWFSLDCPLEWPETESDETN